MSLFLCSVCGRSVRGDHCSVCFNSAAPKPQRHATLTGAVVARRQVVAADESVADEVVPAVKSMPVQSVRAKFYQQIRDAAASTASEPEIPFSDPAADETTVVSGVDHDDDDEVAFGSDAAAEQSLAGVTGSDDPPMTFKADNLSSLFPLPTHEEADPAFDQAIQDRLDEIDEL